MDKISKTSGTRTNQEFQDKMVNRNIVTRYQNGTVPAIRGRMATLTMYNIKVL